MTPPGSKLQLRWVAIHNSYILEIFCISFISQIWWSCFQHHRSHRNPSAQAYMYWNKSNGVWWMDEPSGNGVYIAKAPSWAPPQTGWKALGPFGPLPSLVATFRDLWELILNWSDNDMGTWHKGKMALFCNAQIQCLMSWPTCPAQRGSICSNLFKLELFVFSTFLQTRLTSWNTLLSNRGDPARIWFKHLSGIPLDFMFRWIGPWINYRRHMYEQMQESMVDKYG